MILHQGTVETLEADTSSARWVNVGLAALVVALVSPPLAGALLNRTPVAPRAMPVAVHQPRPSADIPADPASAELLTRTSSGASR